MRRALLLVVLAALACGVPNRPLPVLQRTVRTVSRSFIEETITRRRVSGVTMKIFNTGGIHTRGAAVSSLKSWSSKVRLDVPAFAIQHPDQGIVLFDAGLTPETAKVLNRGALTGLVVRFDAPAGRDLLTQLKKDGTPPEDVRWIILSHLHLDHLADLSAFPKATVVVSRQEWDDAKRRQKEKPDAKNFDPAAWESKLRLRLVDLSGEGPYGAFDHSLDLFADGSVILVSVPGHTPGSIGAWLNLDGGPALLAGDAAWVVDNYMDLAMPHDRGMQDPAAYRRSLEMIRAMQEVMPRLVVFPGHDLTPRKLSNREDLPIIP